jgi:sugar lactone lactonase YvrE
MVNDIAVAADGTVFATLTRTGQLIRIDPATQVVSRLLPKGAIPDANGITVSGAALFVSSWRDIYRVDLPSLRVRPLPKPSSVVSGCFDGLYSVGDELVGIQNCVHATGRAMVLHLDDEGERIERARVLESYNPLFDTVTTAAVVGDELVFVANVQFRKMGKPANAFDRLRIVSVKIR